MIGLADLEARIPPAGAELKPAFGTSYRKTDRLSETMAAGGGLVTDREGQARPHYWGHRERLRQHSHVFYLRSSPDELYRRLRHDTQRPLLQVQDPLAKLRDLYRDRDPLYRRTAHFVVESVRPSVPALTGMVLMQLELAGLVDPQQVPSHIGNAAAT